MAWSVVGTNHNAGNTSISLAMPTGTASGDTILLFIHHESASTAAPTPTGYTLIGDKLNTSQALRVTAFSKVAGASEPAVTCVGGTGWSWQEPALIVVRGGASSAPVDLSSNNQGSGTAASAPTITTTAADMLVAFFTNWNGGESFTTPTGFTAQLSDSADGLYLFSQAQSAAGATGAVSSTLSASDAWVGWLVAVLPASGGGGTVSSGVVNMGNVDGGLAPQTAIVLVIADITTLGGGGGLFSRTIRGNASVGMADTGGLFSSTIYGSMTASAAGGVWQGGIGGGGGILSPGMGMLDGGIAPTPGAFVTVNVLTPNQASVETDTSGFASGSGTTIAQDGTQSLVGSASLHWTTDGASTFQWLSIDLPAAWFVPGATYALSFSAKANSGTPTVRYFMEANNNIAGNHSMGGTSGLASLTGAWQRFVRVAAVDATLPSATIGLRLDTGSPAQALDINIDAIQIEQASGATPWVPGMAQGVTPTGMADTGGISLAVISATLGTASPGGLVASAVQTIGSGVVTLGESGPSGLVASGQLLPITSGLVDVGTTSPSGLLASGVTLVRSGVLSLGTLSASGLVASATALVRSGTLTLGASGPSGLVASGHLLFITSGLVVLGTADIDGLLASGVAVVRSGMLSVGTALACGIGPVLGNVGDPSGHWAEVTTWIWRETFPGSGVGQWVLLPAAVWRETFPGSHVGHWVQLTT